MDEKMMILKMLEEGKVTAEQAAELLKAVGASEAAKPHVPPGAAAPEADAGRQYRREAHTGASDAPRHNNGPSPQGEHKGPGFEEIAADLRVRLGVLAKELEPKIKSLAGTMAEKTADFADKVARAADPKPEGGGFAGEARQGAVYHTPPRHGGPLADTEHTFETVVTGTDNELVIVGHYAPVVIKGYNGDKISAKISCRPTRHDARISLVSHGSKYMLNYDETAFSAIAIDAYVPERMFRAVRVSCEGGSVAVSNVCADDVSIQTAGGRADVSDVSGRRGLIESEGGAISAVNLDIENMKIETNNAPIQLSITNLSKYGEYTWCVETGNGRIVASLPSAHGLGYHVKARSALGGVKIGLTGLSFLHNMPANTEARSANFDTCATRVKLDLENSNEDIVIN